MADVVTYDHTFGGLSSPVPLSYLDDNFGNVVEALGSLNTFSNYLLDTGAANAYAVTLGAGLAATLQNGLLIQVKIANANTGAATLNFNSTGAKSIKNIDGSALVGDQLSSGGFAEFIYSASASSWILLTSANGVSRAFKTASGVVAGVANNTFETLFDPSAVVGMFNTFSYITNGSNATFQGWCMVLSNDNGQVSIPTKGVGAGFDFQLSGNNVQAKQTSGGPQDIAWVYQRVSPTP